MSEEQVVRNCAPTLAGLKTGNMFSCDYVTPAELYDAIRSLNQKLGPKGLRVLPLRWDGGRALIYVFRPSRLLRDLSEASAAAMLKGFGYPCGTPERCIGTLMRRLRQGNGFPHEIGLFLGYPTEDVAGFIANGARGSKCSGCWKVYGDETAARKAFSRYKRCTDVYCRRWRSGTSLEQLAVKI